MPEKKMKVIVSISKACDACGGAIRVAVASTKPIAARQDTASVGGYCVRTAILEIEVDGKPEESEELGGD